MVWGAIAGGQGIIAVLPFLLGPLGSDLPPWALPPVGLALTAVQLPTREEAQAVERATRR